MLERKGKERGEERRGEEVCDSGERKRERQRQRERRS